MSEVTHMRCSRTYMPTTHPARKPAVCTDNNASYKPPSRFKYKKRFSSKIHNGLRIISNWSYIEHLASVTAVYYLWTTGMMVLPACVFINCRASSHCAERSPIHIIIYITYITLYEDCCLLLHRGVAVRDSYE